MLDKICYRYANRNDWRTKQDPTPTLSATKIKKHFIVSCRIEFCMDEFE